MGILDKLKDIKKGYDTLNNALAGKGPGPSGASETRKESVETVKAPIPKTDTAPIKKIENPQDSANYWNKLK